MVRGGLLSCKAGGPVALSASLSKSREPKARLTRPAHFKTAAVAQW